MKQQVPWLLSSLFVMLGLPWISVAFLRSDVGMAVCFLLFFAVNPVYCIFAGVYAGKELRQRWFHPIVTAFLFLLGSWLLFDMGESAFVLYAAGYLGLGIIAMAVSRFLKR